VRRLKVRQIGLPFARAKLDSRGMTILTVNAKGQVTLKRDVLRHLGVEPGGKITVEKRPGGGVALATARPAGNITDIFGLLRRPDAPALSIEAINALAESAWTERR
jgi:bifunctional DNA-binding transcriptional regulator/antitoxin component of YhaV-PrlF toxin-antitoxin module